MSSPTLGGKWGGGGERGRGRRRKRRNMGGKEKGMENKKWEKIGEGAENSGEGRKGMRGRERRGLEDHSIISPNRDLTEEKADLPF